VSGPASGPEWRRRTHRSIAALIEEEELPADRRTAPGSAAQWPALMEDQAMPTARYRGPPITPASMRAQGVRSLSVTCELCHHAAVLFVDAWRDHVPVPWFGPHVVCTCCGIVGADARPNWLERAKTRELHRPTAATKSGAGASASDSGC
jgi:hypothetical protein